jgi:hypothetical protein
MEFEAATESPGHIRFARGAQRYACQHSVIVRTRSPARRTGAGETTGQPAPGTPLPRIEM